MQTILPNNKLTIIIRDNAPVRHLNDVPIYKSVILELTEEQVKKIELNRTDHG